MLLSCLLISWHCISHIIVYFIDHYFRLFFHCHAISLFTLIFWSFSLIFHYFYWLLDYAMISCRFSISFHFAAALMPPFSADYCFISISHFDSPCLFSAPCADCQDAEAFEAERMLRMMFFFILLISLSPLMLPRATVLQICCCFEHTLVAAEFTPWCRAMPRAQRDVLLIRHCHAVTMLLIFIFFAITLIFFIISSFLAAFARHYWLLSLFIIIILFAIHYFRFHFLLMPFAAAIIFAFAIYFRCHYWFIATMIRHNMNTVGIPRLFRRYLLRLLFSLPPAFSCLFHFIWLFSTLSSRRFLSLRFFTPFIDAISFSGHADGFSSFFLLFLMMIISWFRADDALATCW